MGRIPASRSPSGFAADSQDVSPSLGSVTFLGGTSDTVWWVSLRARPSNAALLELFFPAAAHGTQAHLYAHTCRSPLEWRATPHTPKFNNFLTEWPWGGLQLRPQDSLVEQATETIWLWKPGFPLCLGGKETGDGIYVLDRENMPSTPGTKLFLTVLILPTWEDTMAYTDILFPPDRHISSKALLSARHQRLPSLQG